MNICRLTKAIGKLALDGLMFFGAIALAGTIGAVLIIYFPIVAKIMLVGFYILLASLLSYAAYDTIRDYYNDGSDC